MASIVNNKIMVLCVMTGLIIGKHTKISCVKTIEFSCSNINFVISATTLLATFNFISYVWIVIVIDLII